MFRYSDAYRSVKATVSTTSKARKELYIMHTCIIVLHNDNITCRAGYTTTAAVTINCIAFETMR